MDLSDFKIKDFINIEGEESLGKVATILAIVDDQYDDDIIESLKKEGYKAVITRAGGKGEELKNKILRNCLGAAIKGGVITESIQDQRVLTRCVERAMVDFNTPMLSISGAGIKIGIASKGPHLAVALYGKLGIPGLDVDHEISGMGIHYYGLAGNRDE
ncbi:HutP family protein [Halothermothrix orenii]|uniref:Hut operon positive regulatory protein n=1 Tax=Halothermothrix orenii (strain H 168 / OCM 544 / DSM 9562) TaxID=373903 RepID=B8CZC6_HALOH|nr:HutP family protein [Halothermothrix orenii]ACL70645.1 HutP family protein [Halothermothrix orenii H 168]